MLEFETGVSSSEHFTDQTRSKSLMSRVLVHSAESLPGGQRITAEWLAEAIDSDGHIGWEFGCFWWVKKEGQVFLQHVSGISPSPIKAFKSYDVEGVPPITEIHGDRKSCVVDDTSFVLASSNSALCSRRAVLRKTV